MSRAELLRPWADAPCQKSARETFDAPHSPVCAGGCKGTNLDPRFAGLRGEHDFERGSGYHETCRICGIYKTKHDPGIPYCLRTDLGALARVAAACGWTVADIAFFDGAYHVQLTTWGKGIIDNAREDEAAAEVEDAFTKALVAALRERAA